MLQRLLGGGRGRWASSGATTARERACSAVPWESALVHGGAPPSKWNMYSQAIPPARCVASGTTSFSEFLQLGVLVPLQVSSRWPRRRSRATGSRCPGRGSTPRRCGCRGSSRAGRRRAAVRWSTTGRLRSSVRNSAGRREATNSPAAAICWTFSSTAAQFGAAGAGELLVGARGIACRRMRTGCRPSGRARRCAAGSAARCSRSAWPRAWRRRRARAARAGQA